MSEKGKYDIKKRLDFLISESLKNVNYFLTRINIIILQFNVKKYKT